MSIEQFTVPGSGDGTISDKTVPMAQYAINETQQVVCIALDFAQTPVDLGTSALTDGRLVESLSLGKLSEQNIIFQMQIRNSLVNDRWDFAGCRDPEIILLDCK